MRSQTLLVAAAIVLTAGVSAAVAILATRPGKARAAPDYGARVDELERREKADADMILRMGDLSAQMARQLEADAPDTEWWCNTAICFRTKADCEGFALPGEAPQHLPCSVQLRVYCFVHTPPHAHANVICTPNLQTCTKFNESEAGNAADAASECIGVE